MQAEVGLTPFQNWPAGTDPDTTNNLNVSFALTLPDLPPQPVDPGHVKGLRAVNTREEFEAILREAPPVNPFLAARWRELGVAVPGPAGGTSEGAGTPAPSAVGGWSFLT